MLKSAPRPFDMTLKAVDALPEGTGRERPKGNFVTLAVGNSTELEQNMSLRIQATQQERGGKAPAISYIGIFSGAEKPKPFQRRRASLTQNVSDALPSPQVMRRISMSVTRTRQSGVRRQLALQHIHEGHNYFGVSLPGGQTSFLVVDYDGLQLVDNPTVRPLQPRWETAWLDREGESLVSQWQVQGDMVRVNVRDPRHGDDITQSFNTAGAGESAGPMHVIHTMEFYMNTALAAAGKETVPGSTHGRDVVMVLTLTGAVDAKSTSSAKLAAQMSRKAQSEVPLPSKGRRFSIGGTAPWWSKLVRYQGWMLKKGA